MDVAYELLNVIIRFLDQPAVRAFVVVIGIASAVLGLRATINAKRLMEVTQLQTLNDQWQKINLAILSNEDVTRTVQSVLEPKDAETLRRYTFFQFLVNLLFQAWVSRKNNITDEASYGAHFASVTYYFGNREEPFFAIATPADYSANFVKDCKRRFADLKPLSRSEVSGQINGFARLIDEQPGPM